MVRKDFELLLELASAEQMTRERLHQRAAWAETLEKALADVQGQRDALAAENASLRARIRALEGKLEEAERLIAEREREVVRLIRESQSEGSVRSDVARALADLAARFLPEGVRIEIRSDS